MKGHVPTPDAVVDAMVERLFSGRQPQPTDVVIDPGCGDGAFIRGVIRFCATRGLTPPKIIGVESDPRHIARARSSLASAPTVSLLEQDYLSGPTGPADYIVGNPPYVSILGLDQAEKKRYRDSFSTAVGRFDLYLLFFERSLANLKPGGRLVFITPEKFEYVHTAKPLRKLLADMTVHELDHVDEETFPGLVTFPTITTLEKTRPSEEHQTLVRLRHGEERRVRLPKEGLSWSACFSGASASDPTMLTFKDITYRISCGVATGSDAVYVHRAEGLPESLLPFAYPTLSGRQLSHCPPLEVQTKDVMLIPYDRHGNLLPEEKLGSLGVFLNIGGHKAKLEGRSCVQGGTRAWYRFHDSVPMPDLLQRKILWKDIAAEPQFWPDWEGQVVPRHTVYYAVPRDGVDFAKLLDYLNSEEAIAWLKAHAQRAANGFYRLQSRVVQNLPVPMEVLKEETPMLRATRGKNSIGERQSQQRLVLEHMTEAG